jgi:hypothetical protein
MSWHREEEAGESIEGHSEAWCWCWCYWDGIESSEGILKYLVKREKLRPRRGEQDGLADSADSAAAVVVGRKGSSSPPTMMVSRGNACPATAPTPKLTCLAFFTAAVRGAPLALSNHIMDLAHVLKALLFLSHFIASISVLI